MKRIVKKLLLLGFMLSIGLMSLINGRAAHAMDPASLPAPQLVTDAWMFMAGYKADPAALSALLPPGLEPTGNIVINMYTVPEATQTSGFGAYTLTYLTVEIKGQDSYIMGSDKTYPGRYFVHYYNSSPFMRDYTKRIGIPAEEGMTTTTVKDGKLTAVLIVGGQPFIEATADVGSELGNFGGGHLNYFGLIETQKDGKTVKQLVKYPIPWNGGKVDLKNPKITFTAPEGHPLNNIKPQGDPLWAIWTQGSFVYPQYVVINEWTE